jgi:4-methyl-5(b-hydroxyethyl)-thiazole monophosphate biosynthesis
MAKVLIPLADGFEEIEAISIIDVLRRGGVQVITAAISKRNVIGANGVNVVADEHIDDAKATDFDLIALPGGNLGYVNLAKSTKVIELLREFDKAKKPIAAICAAPYVLNKAGVLKNSYTCYPSMELEIGKKGYISDKAVVIDANIITSRGPATAITFGLEILKKLKGEDIAKSVRQALLA